MTRFPGSSCVAHCHTRPRGLEQNSRANQSAQAPTRAVDADRGVLFRGWGQKDAREPG
ncbi:hypothetical protein BJY01DRAFT_209731 [Aspergillus pseudoustus]|uniref:Uncharacterized protein n=1 Tax=Aspergillus pseudoustus TaxID=1810923 RepID=A0ABR4KEG1_9EURO